MLLLILLIMTSISSIAPPSALATFPAALIEISTPFLFLFYPFLSCWTLHLIPFPLLLPSLLDPLPGLFNFPLSLLRLIVDSLGVQSLICWAVGILTFVVFVFKATITTDVLSNRILIWSILISPNWWHFLYLINSL